MTDTGWFSDIDTEQTGDYIWQPCLQLDGGHCPCFQVWFDSKEACDAFIRDEVLGQTWHRTASDD